MKKIVKTNKAPSPPAPFSQAVVVGNLVFTCGMGGLDPKTCKVVGKDIRSQARQMLENTRMILEAEGCTMDDIVKGTIYLTDLDYYEEVNDIYREYFKKDLPARTCVEVSRLPLQEKVKIEVIAVKSDRKK